MHKLEISESVVKIIEHWSPESRALSLLIAKSKTHGGFQYHTYTKLYDSLVWSVISYGAAVWGTKEFSCINAVQHRAIRFFMGLGKYAPIDAINGDMGWKPASVKQWSCVFRHWTRCNGMSVDRINHRVFVWCHRNAVSNKKNWCFRTMAKFREHNLDMYTDLHNIFHKSAIPQFEDVLFDKYKVEWQNRILSQNVGKKLRTYKLFKQDFETELYLSKTVPYRYRRAFAKFRCGVAPLRIETGRYENKELNERVCFICNNEIEDEKHVLLACPLYADLREQLFYDIHTMNVNFSILSENDKFVYLFQSVECFDIVAKTCFYILSRRNAFLYSG